MPATTRTWVYSTQFSHVSSGASIASNAFSGSADVSSSIASSNSGNYPYAQVALKIDVAGSVSSLSNVIMLYRRDLSIDGTNPAPQPTSAAPAYSAIPVGQFSVPPVTASTANMYLTPIGGPVELTLNCAFYIENRTNATINANWTMVVKPQTDQFS